MSSMDGGVYPTDPPPTLLPPGQRSRAATLVTAKPHSARQQSTVARNINESEKYVSIAVPMSAHGSHKRYRSPPSHSRLQDGWHLFIYSVFIKITPEGVDSVRKERGRFQDQSTADYLHNLLAASFVPLTEHYQDPKKIQRQATEFLSAFHKDALWDIDVKSITHREAQVIHGSTPNARNPGIGARFVRFRFPLSDGNNVQIEVLWSMWSRGGAASGLVGYGTTKDTLGFDTDGSLVIYKREFIVTQVFQAELMTPTPYPEAVPPWLHQDDFAIFSTSQTFIQFLRSSQRKMTVLVALSALFASLQPIVSQFSSVGGWVFAGIGVTTAMISLLSLFVAWVLGWAEANSAKYSRS